MVIKRYLSESNVTRMEEDFKFLLGMIQGSHGEMDLALRDNYFNIYYKGNSLAKVEFQKETYRVSIHRKFVEGTSVMTKDKRFKGTISGNEYRITLPPNLLKAFFQKKYLQEFQSRIKNTNHGEEMTLEQQIITDNAYSRKYIILDRQVQDTDTTMKGQIDLLAAKRMEDGKYKMVILEVKRGDNKELKNDVAEQLKRYIDHVEKNYSDYKKCYEKRYKQMASLELYKNSVFHEETIEFADYQKNCVEGMVVVVGYSQTGINQVNELKKNHPDLDIVVLDYRLP